MPDDSVDELLSAFDQFTDAVYWLRSRSGYTAAQALAEALDDWIDSVADDIADRSRAFGADDLDTGVIALAAAVDSGWASSASALTEALQAWTGSRWAEHHASEPFELRTSRREVRPAR